jgi:hypothetical protein
MVVRLLVIFTLAPPEDGGCKLEELDVLVGVPFEQYVGDGHSVAIVKPLECNAHECVRVVLALNYELLFFLNVIHVSSYAVVRPIHDVDVCE